MPKFSKSRLGMVNDDQINDLLDDDDDDDDDDGIGPMPMPMELFNKCLESDTEMENEEETIEVGF